MLAAWHLDGGKFVELGKDLINEQVTPIRHTNLAYVAEWSKYALERSIGRPAADLYLQDITTGARTKLKDGVNDRYLQVGASGKYMLFLDEGHYWTINLATRAITNITKTVPTSFIDNSPVFNVHNMSVPLLLEVGDVDGTVAWYQGIELYNIARRAKRNVVMLAYIGEDHGLRRKENQRDYQDRILAWFGHYLKDEPTEIWITNGKSFLERDAEVKRLKQKK